jgi:hypothetical protein
MTNALKVSLAAATVLLTAFGANAGDRKDLPVVIDTVNRVAGGALGSARNSFDGIQYIACVIHGGELDVIAQCSARNAAGVTRLCNTGNTFLISVIEALPSDGYVSFSWNTDSQCTGVHVFNVSSNAPKR